MMGTLKSFFASLRGMRLVVFLVLLVGLLMSLARAFAAAYVEILWHGQSGYAGVFWTRVAWQWGLRIGAGVAVALLLFANLKLVSRTLSGIHIKRRFGNLEISEQLPRAYVLWTVAALAALLGLWFGAAIPGNLGVQLLILGHAGSWGVVEPIFGHDVRFFVFWLPVLASAVTFALIVVFLVFTLCTAGYAATGALSWGKGRIDAQETARLHLGALLSIFLVLLAGRMWLGRYLLLLDGTSGVSGIFGFADAEARLPALQTLTIIAVLAAGGVLWGSWKNRSGPLIASFSGVILGTLVIGQFYPNLIQRFRVEPNELARETPFIEYNLDFTRLGFGLDSMERRAFDFAPEEPVDWPAAAKQFAGLPVWTRSTLLATYRELEARFPYYDFSRVAFDRYPGPDGPIPVAVSVREVDPLGIQDPNWQNRHIRETYVEGMGAVASLASERTPEGRPPMLISGIPPERSSLAAGAVGLDLRRTEIFFGDRQQRYAVVSPGPDRFLAPDGSEGRPGIDFPPGIELASTFRTALLAWRFRDANLLFATDLTDESRFVYRRRVRDRVQAIAPFLRFPEDPYPVIAEGRVVWVIEGFTGTRAFPLADARNLGTVRSSVSYVRNSVKVTVDAVTGRVDFYRVPIRDPLLDAYADAFPGLIQPIEQMPAELRGHLRYSSALLAIQSRVLLQYHQETARAFHGQQDVWATPQEFADGTTPVTYRPEYGLYALPGEAEARFHLTAVFVPATRQNLTAVLAARTDDRGVPELVLYDVPVTDQVPGPRQIEALVEQDPQISQQFSLWRTGGSEVWTGHLHLVPAGRRIVYMEPVFLAAEKDAIPELRRFVVSDGIRVAMTEDLPGAISALAGSAVEARDAATTPTHAATDVGERDAWPAAALDLLETAEARARAGDWQGFGEALAELRSLLRSLSDSGG
jgi:uncharacterized protein